MKIRFLRNSTAGCTALPFVTAAEGCDATRGAQRDAAGSIIKALHNAKLLSVPRTGFEPAHPCGRCDLNTVRLPISPSGHSGLQM